MKYDPEVMAEALRQSKGLIFVASRKLTCSPITIRSYAKKFAVVRQAIEEERGYLVDTGELALNKAVLAGEGWAVCFLLKTLGKDRGYVERQEIRHAGEDGGPIIVRRYIGVDPEKV